MIISTCEQGTPEWFAIKAGVASASNFDKIVTTKGELSKQSTKYLYQLAGERITGIREQGYQSASMERGTQLEDEARRLYSLVTGLSIEQVGFVYLDDKKLVGASPDGLVGSDGLLEIKCPEIHTQVGYLLEKCLPMTYFQQVQGQLFVTGRKWCDFVSYYPQLRPLIVRVERDEVFIGKLKTALDSFCDELIAVEKKLREEK